MGKKVKTGKNRLDKYYHLAKEQGYRARSAFKLIQLAQYNDIFSNCRILLDLCAAPGGWLQVAQKNMPVSSQIIGIDLVPIKPIHGVITIQSDITSQRCLSSIKSHLQGERADVVLHDGAPNVGTSWSYDAYSQNELVLSALRIAATFLRLGGTFVTKVFRSQDYLSLLWVFQQLFSRVTATKPSSSRNISAEIFVVCTGYRQPEKLDTKFFDPRHVFLNSESQNSGAASLQKKKRSLSELMKSSNQRHRQGYEKGDDYKEATITEFFNTEKSPAEFIMSHHKLVFDKENEEEQKLLNHHLTTQEVILCCNDLKVLGKREVTLLLKWRHKLLKEARDLEKKKLAPINEQNLSDSDEFSESHLDEKLQTMKAEQAKIAVKEARKRRQLEEKLNLKRKMSLGAFDPVEVDPELFCLKDSNILEEEDQVLEAGKYYDNVEKLNEVSDDLSENNECTFSDVDGHTEIDYLTEQQRLDEMAQNLDMWESQKKDRQREKEAKRQLKKKKETRRELAYAAWNKELADVANKGQCIEAQVDTSDDENEEEEDVNMTINDGTPSKKASVTGEHMKEIQNYINSDEDDNEVVEQCSRIQQKTERWFDQPLFKEAGINLPTVYDENKTSNINNEMEGDCNMNDEVAIREINEDELVSLPLTEKQQRKEKRKRELEKKKSQLESQRKSMKKKGVLDIELKNVLDSTSTKDKDSCSFTTVPRQTAVQSTEGYDEEEAEEANHASVLTFAPKSQKEVSQIQALGSLLAKKRTRFDLIDGAYNRYSFDDDECVPEWFLEDEEQRMRPELPVTKEVMKEYRQKLAELSKRPIRKVLDAQGRKKQKMRKRIQSAKNKAEVVASSAEYTESSKAATIQKIMRNATRDTAKGKTYVASRKKGGSTTVGRNRQGERGGKIRMVDKRLKKDKRAQKLKRKRSKR